MSDSADQAKSTVISALVQQLKNGEISRSELFSRLAELQKGTADAAPAPAAAEGGFASPDRRVIVQRLIDERKRSAAAAGDGAAAPGAAAGASIEHPRPQPQPITHAGAAPLSFSQFAGSGGAAGAGAGAGAGHDAPPPPPPHQAGMPSSGPRRASSAPRQRPQSARRAATPRAGAGPATPVVPPYPGGVTASYDDTFLDSTPNATVPRGFSLSTARRAQDARAQDLQDAQMAECTFKPTIRELPAHYGRSRETGMSFSERTQAWKEKRDEELRRRQLEAEEEENKACTFRPHVNPKSRAVAARKAPATPAAAAAAAAEPADEVPGSATERLYQQNKQRLEERARLEAQARAREEEELKRSCTFRPKVSARRKSRGATPVASRYRNPTPERRRPAQDVETPSFVPKVNPVSPSMGSAKLYLERDIFERLSETPAHVGGGAGGAAPAQAAAQAGQDDGDQPIVDMESFMSSVQDDSGATAAAVAATPERRRAAPRGGGGERERPQSTGRRRPLTAEERRERDERFNAFLQRSKVRQMKKEKRIEEVRQQMTPKHKPKLNRNSMRITAQTRQGTFEERARLAEVRRSQEAKRRRDAMQHDSELTFKPQINAQSAARPARSVVEMSRGDALAKATSQRLLKLRVEQEELQGLTFQPQINETGVESKLKVRSDPDSYLQRLQRDAAAFSERRRAAVQQQELQEFAECTFKPQVHDAPAYIKRIAKSMALTKKAAPAEAKGRPEWR